MTADDTDPAVTRVTEVQCQGLSVFFPFILDLHINNNSILTTINSIGTGMNIRGFSFGFWLINLEVQYSIVIQAIDSKIVT